MHSIHRFLLSLYLPCSRNCAELATQHTKRFHHHCQLPTAGTALFVLAACSCTPSAGRVPGSSPRPPNFPTAFHSHLEKKSKNKKTCAREHIVHYFYPSTTSVFINSPSISSIAISLEREVDHSSSPGKHMEHSLSSSGKTLNFPHRQICCCLSCRPLPSALSLLYCGVQCVVH